MKKYSWIITVVFIFVYGWATVTMFCYSVVHPELTQMEVLFKVPEAFILNFER